MNIKSKNDFWMILVTAAALCIMFPFVFSSIKAQSERMTGNAARLTERYSFLNSGTFPDGKPSPGEDSGDAGDGTVSGSSQAGASASDAGETIFKHSGKSYFDNALFIGDSRTDDLRQFGTLDNADYFARVGMSVFNIDDKPVNVDGLGKVSFDRLLSARGYGKIYIMLGFNEIGYNLNVVVKEYGKLIERIQRSEPTAIIYIEANLLVSEEKSKKADEGTNEAFTELNRRLSELADNERVFYIDVNPLFCENGALRADLSGDGTHPYAKHYKTWCEWLCDNTVDVSRLAANNSDQQ